MFSLERKVNLFLVGAMKAATTSMFAMLSRHPDIYAPPIKEPNYFSGILPFELFSSGSSFSIERYFEKDFPRKRLHIANIQRREHYDRLYSSAENENYLLDASTSYLHAPGAIERILHYNPNAKFIVIVRDPIERAYSHYLMDVGLGLTSRSFQRELEYEVSQYHSNTLNWFSKLGMSRYTQPLEILEKLKADRICIEFDDLVSYPKITLDLIFKFLNVDPISIDEFPALNPSRTFDFRSIIRLLRQLGLYTQFKNKLGSDLKRSLIKTGSRRPSPYTLNVETKQELDKIFSYSTILNSYVDRLPITNNEKKEQQ